MTVEELEKKYETELEALRELSPETTTLNAALVLRNVIAAILAPVMQDPDLKGNFMELFTLDLKAAGYTVTEDPVPEKEGCCGDGPCSEEEA